jgi:hypothetical protein
MLATPVGANVAVTAASAPHEQAPLASAAPQQGTAAAAAAAAAGAKKKKITRLIPAEESLAAIEECTEHSEDSETMQLSASSVFSKQNSKSKMVLRDAPNILGEAAGDPSGDASSIAGAGSAEAAPPRDKATSTGSGQARGVTRPATTTAVKSAADETSSNGTEKTVTSEEHDDDEQSTSSNPVQAPSIPTATNPVPHYSNMVASSSAQQTVSTTTTTPAEPPPAMSPVASFNPPTPVKEKLVRSPVRDHHQQQQPPSQLPSSPLSPSRLMVPPLANPPHNVVPSDPPSTATHHMNSSLNQSINLSSLDYAAELLEENDYDNRHGDGGGGSTAVAAAGEEDVGHEDGDHSFSGNHSDAVVVVGPGGPPGHQSQEGEFDFEDDFPDDFEEPEKEEILTWRLDPSVSLSDWTLVVRVRESGSASSHAPPTSYHVHKNILAVGPRKSDYFVNVFRTSAASSSTSNVTEVVLGEVAARVVPQLLDFMYSVEGDLDINSARACGLRHLAQFFGVRALHKRVTDFIQKDLTMSSVVTYYVDVVSLRDEKLLVNIAKFCSKNIMKIDTAFPLVEVMDPYFFSKLLTSQHINTKEKRYHCSLLVAEYCRMNKKRLDGKRFLMLTDEASLPVVHYSAALTLMEMEADVVVTTSLESLMGMTSLQSRCVRDLSSHWRDLVEMDMQVITRVCRKLPSSVVTELLVRSLSSAKRKLNDPEAMEVSSKHSMGTTGTVGTTSSRQSTRTRDRGGERNEKPQLHLSEQPGDPSRRTGAAFKKEIRDLRKEYEAKMEQMKHAHLEEMTRLKKEYDMNLVRLRDMLIDKDKTISKFWNEIKSFERMPNNLDGKLVASGRQHEASFMPEVRPTTVDGYLYVGKKGGAKYPVFFYKREEREKSDSAASVGTR